MNRKEISRGLHVTCIGLIIAVLLSLMPDAMAMAQEPVPDDGSSRTFLPILATGGRNNDLSQLSALALEIVAQQNDVPQSELSVVQATPSDYVLTNTHVYNFKISDASGTTYGITLDADGVVYDGEALAAAEEEAYVARYGRLSPELVAVLESSDAPESVNVIIWLHMDDYDPMARPPIEQPEAQDVDQAARPGDIDEQQSDNEIARAGTATDSLPALTAAEEAIAQASPPSAAPDDAESVAAQSALDAYFAAVDARLADAVSAATQPMVAQLAELGVDATAATHAPAVYARLDVSTARTVGSWPDVDRVYLDVVAQSQMNISRQVVGANVVNSRGFTGSGIRVAAVEVGGRIATSNPYLSGVVQDTTHSCSSSHATAVAGVIRSTHGTVRGIAPGATLWVGGSCGGDASQLQNRSSAAATWGARVFNLSFGGDTNRALGVLDRFYDNMVINQFRTVVVAAGNMGGTGCFQGTDGDVATPGLAYNVITVGMFDDKNTVSTSGDTMNPCSSWRDPVSNSGDREKPEVAAPGTGINTTSNAYPWTTAIVDGTSFAAPIVAGGAALLMQRNSSLTSWPEAVKAILMASALQNIEGSARLSERDGAGGVILWRADDIARRFQGNWGAQSYTCSTASQLTVASFTLAGGRRFRSVIAWDNNPNYSSYATRPSADLDLKLLNPAGAVVASSLSFDNTYEVIDFTPSTSGVYRLRVDRHRCNYTPQWLGWAWYQP